MEMRVGHHMAGVGVGVGAAGVGEGAALVGVGVVGVGAGWGTLQWLLLVLLIVMPHTREFEPLPDLHL